MTEQGILSLLWQQNTGIGRLILFLLFALGAAAATAALRHLHRYHTLERLALDGVRARLRGIRAREETERAEESYPAVPPPVELDELRQNVPAGTLIGDRLAALARMKEARVKVNLDALQQITLLRENASLGLAFPGYASDLAMMLGMLGTFVGLCLMLMQMQGVLPSATGVPAAGGFAEAAQSLGGIIASKKTAFVTTLVGLACAIAISALNFFLARAQAACYGALERFTTEELLPATVGAVEDETAMERLSLQLSDTFASLGNLSEHQAGNLERLQEMQVAFATIVDSIRAVTHHSARGPAEEAAGALTTLVRQLGDANHALVKVAESVALRAVHARFEGAPARRTTLGAWLDDGLTLARRNPLHALAGVGAVAAILVYLF